MHSSRMRTGRSSSRLAGGDTLNFPLGCGPGPDPPKLPPWLLAWRPPPRPKADTPLGPKADPPTDQKQTPLCGQNS